MNNEEYLSHHGILGQKWGVRRFQNSDGSLTNEGKKRYSPKTSKDYYKEAGKHAEKSKTALKVMGASSMAALPASLITAGMALTSAALTPAVLGGLAVTSLLAGTAATAKYIAAGQAYLAGRDARTARALLYADQ